MIWEFRIDFIVKIVEFQYLILFKYSNIPLES